MRSILACTALIAAGFIQPAAAEVTPDDVLRQIERVGEETQRQLRIHGPQIKRIGRKAWNKGAEVLEDADVHAAALLDKAEGLIDDQ